MSESSSIPLKDHSILILPFTPSTLLDPNKITPIILDILPKSSRRSFTIIFTTPSLTLPSNSSTSTSISLLNEQNQEQLYTTLKSSPSAYFQIFQNFLSKVYGALATAQCLAGNLLMDVEVYFDGEPGTWGDKLFRGDEGVRGEYQSISVEGVPISPHIHQTLTAIPQITLPSISTSNSNTSSSNQLPHYPPVPGPEVVALGGTFDHLHAAHKLLLHLSSFLSTRKIIVGVISDELLGTKKYHNLIQPLRERIPSTRNFLDRLNGSRNQGTIQGEGAGEIILDISEIKDAYGPTKYEEDIQALIVSKETISGGKAVNEIREQHNLPQLEIFIVDVISDQIGLELNGVEGVLDEGKLKEMKMGSTGIRKWIFENGQQSD